MGFADPSTKYDHVILGNWKDMTMEHSNMVKEWGEL